MNITIDNQPLTPVEQQAVKSALDIYSRFHQGMFADIGNLFAINAIGIDKFKRRRIKRLFKLAQIALFGDSGIAKRIGDNTVSRMALIAQIVEAKLNGDIEHANKLMSEFEIHTPGSPHNQLGGLPNNDGLDEKVIEILLQNKNAILSLANEKVDLPIEYKSLIRCLALFVLDELNYLA